MDSKIKILIVILVVGILLAGMLFFISTGALIIIKTCTSDEDCKSTCTWGCINKISIYQEREKCYFLPHCECIKNKCVPILENCSLLEKQIKEKIAKANYCEKDEDCIIVEEFGCPFGCYNLINKKELEAIRLLIKEYGECTDGIRCLYKCAPPPESVGCENEVCVPKPSKKSVWTEGIRKKYCGNYSRVLQEKISKIEPKPRGAVFHKITVGEILRITKEGCNYTLNISPLEEIYVPYIGKRIELFHPKQLYYIGDCNESINLKEGDRFIAFSISYEINDTFPTWTICINKIENYEEAVKLPEKNNY